ncbi:DUF6644 family protein [Rhizobium sp. YIM 134829]|uniref:DUF6644 family protein n=1 Tax=Rhizobium sp. YIM 134829 TaxID=3390453 RepID=UPI0039792AAD
MLIALLEQIEASVPVRLIVTVPWIYPALSALHILGIATLFGSIAVADLRLMGLLGRDLDSALPTLVRIALVGFVLAASTGSLLVSVRITSYAGNPAFLMKMAILSVAGLNALVLRLGHLGVDLSAIVGTGRAQLSAIMSLLLWISAVFAGRWIPFI